MSGDLEQTWRDVVAKHAKVSCALDQALGDEHALSATDFAVLQRLVESDEGKLRMQELADEIHLSQSALSRLVGRLEDRGLACRTMCEHDRRGIWTCITDEGRVLHDEAAPTHDRVLSETLSAS
ncbi:MAG: MarR family transcriptional regulator [Solirubrobacteraceae bacterium]|nr:MarR family transcriptional regulator [Solirubrobacteraceae bacterium]